MTVLQSLDNKTEICPVFFDIGNAFDSELDYIIEFCQALERQTSYCMHVASHNKNVFYPTPNYFSAFDVTVAYKQAFD